MVIGVRRYIFLLLDRAERSSLLASLKKVVEREIWGIKSPYISHAKQALYCYLYIILVYLFVKQLNSCHAISNSVKCQARDAYIECCTSTKMCVETSFGSTELGDLNTRARTTATSRDGRSDVAQRYLWKVYPTSGPKPKFDLQSPRPKKCIKIL